jgi:hypothetical protein
MGDLVTDPDVTVVYAARDSLPGGAPVLFATQDNRLDVIFSRAVTVDEIVAALGPMYAELAGTAFELRAVA